MSKVEMDRRSILKLLAALSTTSGFSMLSACQSRSVNPPLDGLNTGAIEDAGRSYLNQFPLDHGVSSVWDILNEPGESNEFKIGQLKQLMLVDYENDRTVNLSGWNISRTEGRIFAAVSLGLG